MGVADLAELFLRLTAPDQKRDAVEGNSVRLSPGVPQGGGSASDRLRPLGPIPGAGRRARGRSRPGLDICAGADGQTQLRVARPRRKTACLSRVGWSAVSATRLGQCSVRGTSELGWFRIASLLRPSSRDLMIHVRWNERYEFSRGTRCEGLVSRDVASTDGHK